MYFNACFIYLICFFSPKNIVWTLFYYSLFMEFWNSTLLLTTHTNTLPFTWLRRKWNLTNQATFFHYYKFHFQCMCLLKTRSSSLPYNNWHTMYIDISFDLVKVIIYMYHCSLFVGLYLTRNAPFNPSIERSSQLNALSIMCVCAMNTLSTVFMPVLNKLYHLTVKKNPIDL